MTKDHKYKSIWSPVYNIVKEEFPFTKLKSQIILITENNFPYHRTINYVKSESACIDLSHVVAKKKIIKLWPNDVLVRPTEKVSRKRATSEKNESRAYYYYEVTFIIKLKIELICPAIITA